jgi:deazaflavin-dependent oxidoreductase (nitroreductase family)
MRRSLAVELFWKLHPWLYRITSGRLLGELVGMKVLLLTTTGARSGAQRTTALTYLEVDGAYTVIGSFLGEPRHPGWVHNLRARPDATVQIGARRIPVRAREARGEERAKLWARVVAVQPDYRQYERRADREIPVVVLTPT